MKANKEFIDVAMAELEKDVDIFLIDEIGDRFLFSNHITNKLVDLMEDPGKIVIATGEDYMPGFTG